MDAPKSHTRREAGPESGNLVSDWPCQDGKIGTLPKRAFSSHGGFKMKRLTITALAGVAVGFSGVVSADEPVTEIFSPAPSQVVYENLLELDAADTSAQSGTEFDPIWNNVQWAIRQSTCARSTGTVAGNVDGFSNGFSWEDGFFSAEIDATGFLAGEYCFVLNTTQGAAAGNRQTQIFYIVDEYAKAGGTIYLPDEGGILPPGNSPTDTVEGVVGIAGDAGVVGSITVNYRQVGTYVTYEAENLGFRAANGIGVSDPKAVGVVTAEGGAEILILDRKAATDFPRGALVLRANDCPTFEIDSTPCRTGADSWVPMEKGNNETGTR